MIAQGYSILQVGRHDILQLKYFIAVVFADWYLVIAGPISLTAFLIIMIRLKITYKM